MMTLIHALKKLILLYHAHIHHANILTVNMLFFDGFIRITVIFLQNFRLQ